jgi:GNAT superfamily N-acetyltransferase
MRLEKFAVFNLNIDPKRRTSFPGLNCRWLSEEQIWRAYPVLQQDYEQNWLERRLAADGRLAIAEFDGQIVGWIIFQPGKIEQLDWLEISIPDDAIMSVGEFVVPQFRGKRILSFLKLFAGRYYHKRGITRIISFVKTRNKPSMNAQKNIGAKQFYSIYHALFAGVEFVWHRKQLIIRLRIPKKCISVNFRNLSKL